MLKDLQSLIPDYAKDIRLNLSGLARNHGLTEQQFYGVLVATSLATKNETLIEHTIAEAKQHLTDVELNAAYAATNIMAMNNIYYRFVHLAKNKSYATKPAGLRMNVIANPGVEKIDFELMSLAVSAINGCGLCIDSHEKVLIQAGVTEETIQQAVKIAAVVHAVAQSLVGQHLIALDTQAA